MLMLSKRLLSPSAKIVKICNKIHRHTHTQQARHTQDKMNKIVKIFVKRKKLKLKTDMRERLKVLTLLAIDLS